MEEINKRELLECRISGKRINQHFSNPRSPIVTSSSDCDSNVCHILQKTTVAVNSTENSQKSVDISDLGKPVTRSIIRSSPASKKRKSQVTNEDQKSHSQPSEVISSLYNLSNSPGNINIRTSFISQPITFSSPENRNLLTTRDTDLNISLSEMKNKLFEYENKILESQKFEKKYKESLESARNLIKEFLIRETKNKKRECSENVSRNCKRLGQFTTVRQGAQYVEQWQDGFEFQRIQELMYENGRQRDDIEKLRRSLSRKKTNDKTPTNVRSPCIDSRKNSSFYEESSEDFEIQNELCKIRLTNLRKDEIDINSELEKLICERNSHVKELQRLKAEEASTFNSNSLKNDRYFLLELIGKGGFSEVFKAFDFLSFCYVACKIHQLKTDWKEETKANYIKHAIREYNIHRTLDHPNIVKMLDVFEIDNNSFATIMEYCPGSDLDFLLKQQKTIQEKEARCLIMQVSSALRYLNERKPPIIHFDLKPGNILLDTGKNAWRAMITDFGLSKIMEDTPDDHSIELTSQGAGTYWYLPPECFLMGEVPPTISSKVDVWSIGVILYQCLFGKKPFGHNLSQSNILEQNTILKATSIDFPSKPIVSAEAKNFIKACLTHSKEQRIDVFQMSESPYLHQKKNGNTIQTKRFVQIENCQRAIPGANQLLDSS